MIARTLLQETVVAQLDRADETVQAQMRVGQPNFFLQFDRRGIDPFTDRFEIDLLAEGTVRGNGGIDVVDDDCATTVPGLYVFDRVDGGLPVIARQSDCQTCSMCEACCPTDALYVAPEVTPLPPDTAVPIEHIGRYREKLGWGHGRTAGAQVAVGPRLPHGAPPPRLSS